MGAEKVYVRNRICEFSPAGTAEPSPGRQSWVHRKGDQVPEGRLKVVQDRVAADFQPSLRD
jgi:hypothetical protein